MSDVLMQQCEHCGKIIFGVGNVKKHEKKCKEKLCNQCIKKEDCKFTIWCIPCPYKDSKIIVK